VPETNIELDFASGGSDLRTRTSTQGANTVHEQAVYMPGPDTYYAYVDNVVPALNKHHIGIFNASGSGKVVQCRKLFCVNLHTALITGVILRFDVRKITALTGGSAITPVKANTLSPNLPAQITSSSAPTAVGTETLLFPWLTLSEENPTAQAITTAVYQQAVNILAEGGTVQEYTLREGEGLSVKQITSSTVGSFGWILVFTVI
jgi:hypothetical protein